MSRCFELHLLSPVRAADAAGVGVLDRLCQGLTQMEPCSLDNMQMVVEDADAIGAELADCGIPVGEVDEQPRGPFVSLPGPRRQWLGGPEVAGVGDRHRRERRESYVAGD